MTTVNWTPVKLIRFQKAYREARETNRDSFVFEGNEFVTLYAKYLIEYLESVFEQRR